MLRSLAVGGVEAGSQSPSWDDLRNERGVGRHRWGLLARKRYVFASRCQ
jgi:hypothetical protein